MNLETERKTRLLTKITASVGGVTTLGDMKSAVLAMENEGIPSEATLLHYADRGGTLRFFIEHDKSSALLALRDRLVSYLESVVESEEREGYNATEERDLLNQLNTILEGI